MPNAGGCKYHTCLNCSSVVCGYQDSQNQWHSDIDMQSLCEELSTESYSLAKSRDLKEYLSVFQTHSYLNAGNLNSQPFPQFKQCILDSHQNQTTITKLIYLYSLHTQS